MSIRAYKILVNDWVVVFTLGNEFGKVFDWDGTTPVNADRTLTREFAIENVKKGLWVEFLPDDPFFTRPARTDTPATPHEAW